MAHDRGQPAEGTSLVCASARPSRRTSRSAFQAEPPDPDDPLLGFEPYLHKAPRRNSITPDRQRAFVAALAATGIVTQAALEIGASLEALYRLRNMPGAEGFSRAWEQALDRGIARLEDCALERAIQGEERMFVRGGKVVARWTYYDTSLITFLLRQRRPQRYAATIDYTHLKRGHPVYERLQQEFWQEQEARRPDPEKVRASILRKLEAIQAQEDAILSPRTLELREIYEAALKEDRARVAGEGEEALFPPG